METKEIEQLKSIVATLNEIKDNHAGKDIPQFVGSVNQCLEMAIINLSAIIREQEK